MICYFDTSVLVALVTAEHPHRGRVVAELRASGVDQASVHAGFHVLAEAYSTLTHPALPYALSSGEAAHTVAKALRQTFREVPMAEAVYKDALAFAGQYGFVTGNIYDVLHLKAAESVGADQLWTLNAKHFLRFAPHTDVEIVVP